MFEQMLYQEPAHLVYFDPTAHVLDEADVFLGLRRLWAIWSLRTKWLVRSIKNRLAVSTVANDTRWLRPALRLANGLWFIPALYVVGALAVSVILVHWDESDPIDLIRSINSSSATAALSALGSGMLAFTGFVTSIIFMVVQFGTSEFSSRFVAYFNRDRTLKFALSTFSATFVFALFSTAQVGRGAAAFVPTRTLIAALILLLLSIAMFLLLIDHTSTGLRVASVVQSVDGDARKVFDVVYPSSASDAAAAEKSTRSLDRLTPVQTVRQGVVGSVVVALDRAGLANFAERHDGVIELVPAVGEHLQAGGALLRVYGPRQLPERRLRRRVVLGDERTLDFDPAFAFRMLVDVAIKALSPAVNDPTTAVQSLDRIEGLLHYAAEKHLSTGIVTDRHGAVRLVYPVPTWEDLVELALDEIRAFGAGQYQVVRRLRALLDALIADVPERRRPALLQQRSLLDDAVAAAIPAGQRADALVADRQGIGMSRRSRE
jgi:uncharacterized membrane protein